MTLTATAGIATAGMATAGVGPAAATARPGVARAAARLVLPRPTGTYAVGRDTLRLIDSTRHDPWVPAAPREVMVDVYYPASAADGTPAHYANPDEIHLYLAALGLAGALSADDIAAMTISSRTGAPAAGGHHPLVLLSPGLGVGRRSLTGLAEQLASDGLVAATVDHAYESVGTLFTGGQPGGAAAAGPSPGAGRPGAQAFAGPEPSGRRSAGSASGARMLTCVACDRIRTSVDHAAAVRTRVADLSFVLDRLIGPHPAWRGSATIDPTRIAAVGHSLGGAAAVALLAHDRRVRAAVNLDGTLGEPIAAGGLPGRAVLLLGATADHPGPASGRAGSGTGGAHRTITPAGAGDSPAGAADDPDADDPTWVAAWARLRAPRLWLDVDGADHFSFTDDPVIADQFPAPPAPPAPASPATPASAGSASVPALSGSRALQITRAYVDAFVTRALTGRPEPLLDGPSRTYPDVRVIGH
ncbi:lipase [Frankia sp. AiPa1]|uniref:alpha/beta hydrolase n=1 Tax=Frankia sp. AiPa1 TaxID=573492 RepID=UPI00202BA458|nr:lipase [Frankia sp. AiPa1]MCL9758821.1 lipase [Frankia sp. AiPa1]